MNEWQAAALADVLDRSDLEAMARRRTVTRGPNGSMIVVVLAVDR